jgi:hypothetical protein
MLKEHSDVLRMLYTPHNNIVLLVVIAIQKIVGERKKKRAHSWMAERIPVRNPH